MACTEFEAIPKSNPTNLCLAQVRSRSSAAQPWKPYRGLVLPNARVSVFNIGHSVIWWWTGGGDLMKNNIALWLAANYSLYSVICMVISWEIQENSTSSPILFCKIFIKKNRYKRLFEPLLSVAAKSLFYPLYPKKVERVRNPPTMKLGEADISAGIYHSFVWGLPILRGSNSPVDRLIDHLFFSRNACPL